ncbi:hypothetical protein PRIPAC_86982 [Pristionchus pacificus]|uniref:Uncharacterized protein n=1 Tax=Pristionchus pacificus TaxID=54126 RepID=A0A2A6BTU6_PRIPA|nr:hypothetical protein PRIPAC_86982 [Pristionchus pacificus]|eukprot:PDM69181.1 hypothetical protein PRIPAC_47483 [Pristionchus pacificus]
MMTSPPVLRNAAQKLRALWIWRPESKILEQCPENGQKGFFSEAVWVKIVFDVTSSGANVKAEFDEIMKLRSSRHSGLICPGPVGMETGIENPGAISGGVISIEFHPGNSDFIELANLGSEKSTKN